MKALEKDGVKFHFDVVIEEVQQSEKGKLIKSHLASDSSIRIDKHFSEIFV